MSDAKLTTAYSSEEYDGGADSYSKFEEQITKGVWVMEHQLHDLALGDLTGLTVLDLGGGAGLRARQAIDHGAAAVDVVDRRHTPYSHPFPHQRLTFAPPLPERAKTRLTTHQTT